MSDDTSAMLRSARPSSDIEDARLSASIGSRLFGRESIVSVGRFRLDAHLGSGGMGVVYAAHDPTLQRTVALKLVRADAADEARRSSLLEEARAAARIRHPHVVEIFEAGESDGQVWIAMELCPGPNMRRWCEQRARSWRLVVSLFVQCGEALAAAHRLGVVHRDFKPHNVIIEEAEGGPPRAKVVDFGLAALGADEGAALVAGGTPGFVAPEQRAGEEVDGRADQYSFCVALRGALTGTAPAEDDGRTWPPGIPRWLKSVVAGGEALRAEDRFESMDLVVERLRRGLARRRRLARWTLGGVASSLAAGGMVAMTRPGPDLCAHAADAADEVWGDGTRAAARRFFDAAWPEARRPYVRFERVVSGWIDGWKDRSLAQCEAEERRETGSRESSLARVCLDRRLASTQGFLEEVARAEPTARNAARAVAQAQELPDLFACRDGPTLLRETLPEGSADELAQIRAHDHEIAALGGRLRLTDYSQARPMTQAAVDRARTLGHPPLLARALRLHGHALGEAGQITDAVATAREAYLAAVEGRTDMVAAEAAALVAWMHVTHTRDLDEATRWLEHARAWIAPLDDDHSWATWYDYAGALAYEAGDYEEAERLHERALSFRERDEGLRATRWASLNGLAMDRHRLGRNEPARLAAEEALAALEEALGPEHPNRARVLNNLGAISSRQGRNAEARAYLVEALALKRTALGSENVGLASTMSNLGVIASALGRPEESVDWQRQALELRESALGADHIGVAGNVLDLAIATAEVGRPAEALEGYRRAQRIFEGARGESDRGAIASRVGQAQCLVELDRRDEARRVLEQARAHSEGAKLPAYDRVELRLELARLWFADEARRADALVLAREAEEECSANPDVRLCPSLAAWLAQPATTR